jgi:ferredoxin-nitrite reductase/sulfite reductase (ferredoxin)
LLIGGDVKVGDARFGQPIAAIPARRAPEVVKHLVGLYKKERQTNERFIAVMDRLGKDRLRTEVEPFRTLPPYDQNPEMYFEWGEFQEFHSQVGQGECAA